MANSNSGQARFTQRFTEAQKTAILRAVLADGHTVATARKMAKAGALGVPAFDIGTYAYKLIEHGRERFEANDEDALTHALAKELKGAELDALATIRAIRNRFKRDGTGDTTALARATRDTAQIRKARKDADTQRRATPKRGAEPNTATDTANTPPTASVITDLLAHVPKTSAQSARTGSLSLARNGTAQPE